MKKPATNLIKALDKNRQERWTTLTETIRFQKSSRKARSLLKKLTSDGTGVRKQNLADLNKIAGKVTETANGVNINKQFSKEIRYKSDLKAAADQDDTYASPVITVPEITRAIKLVKTG